MEKALRFLKKYFWDIDFDKLNIQKSAIYVVERILEYGDEKAIRWLFKTYSKDLIKKVVMTRRGLSPKTANFWGIMLDIDKRKIRCLKTPYLEMRQMHWPY